MPKSMIKIVKRLAMAAFGILLITFICSMLTPYKRINHYINRNHENMELACEGYLVYGETDKEYDGIEIQGIFGLDKKIVQFYYTGFGIAPSSKYYGFYYSPEDIPACYCNDRFHLNEITNDEWSWNGDGDNGGIIRKIRDKWYYYEAWF